MGIINIALTLLGAGAELVDRVMGRGQHEKAQLNANNHDAPPVDSDSGGDGDPPARRGE